MQMFPGEDDNISFKRAEGGGGKEQQLEGGTNVVEEGGERSPEVFGGSSAREEAFVALFSRITDESNMDL